MQRAASHLGEVLSEGRVIQLHTYGLGEWSSEATPREKRRSVVHCVCADPRCGRAFTRLSNHTRDYCSAQCSQRARDAKRGKLLRAERI